MKEATNSVIAVASKQDGLELSTQLESIILSYNSVCADLLGSISFTLYPCINMICLDVGTRYDSSVLLWERFISMTLATRQWIEDATKETVEISASTAHVEDLLLQIKVFTLWSTELIIETIPNIIFDNLSFCICKCIG